MSTKIKGMCKGSFKYISQIFVVKERELDIGPPTNVKHLAHIGSDGPNGTPPSWMNEFKGSDFALTSTGGIDGSRNTTWSSHDFENLGRNLSATSLSNFPPTNLPGGIPKNKKTKRRKSKSSTSSPKSGSSRSSRASKSKSILHESHGDLESQHISINS